MRKRIKPIIVFVFLGIPMLLLVVAHLYTLNTISNQLKIAKASIPKNNIESKTNQTPTE